MKKKSKFNLGKYHEKLKKDQKIKDEEIKFQFFLNLNLLYDIIMKYNPNM